MPDTTRPAPTATVPSGSGSDAMRFWARWRADTAVAVGWLRGSVDTWVPRRGSGHRPADGWCVRRPASVGEGPLWRRIRCGSRGAVGLPAPGCLGARERQRAGVRQRVDGAVVDGGEEGGVEAVHQVREPDDEAQLHDLRLLEVRGERGVELVVDRQHAGAGLRVADDGGGFRVVDALGQRVVAEMRELLVV